MEEAMYKHGSAPAIRGKRTIWMLAALCALAAGLGMATTARAETLTLGRLGATNPKGFCTFCHMFQVKTSPAQSYVVPAGEWTVTSWSGQAGEKEATAEFNIYRPTGVAGQYVSIFQSDLGLFQPSAVGTFPLAVPVKGGDVIGLTTGTGYPPVIQTVTEENVLGGYSGSVLVGEMVGAGTAFPLNETNGRQLNVAATISRPDPLPLEEAAPAPTCGGAAAPCAPPLVSRFTLGKQLHKRGSKVVSQTITVTAPGTLSIAGKGIARRQVTATQAGSVTVKLAPTGGLRGSLTRHGKAKGPAQITFTETVRFRLAR
jgi:hypothetical protein